MRTRRVIVALLVLALAASGPGSTPAADPPAPEHSSEITPTRVSYLYGEVSFWRPGAQEWAEAKANTPLAPGDVLYTGPDGNAELQIGPRAFVRAGNGTQIGLDNDDPDFVQLRVTAGHAALDVREIPAGHTVELDTPNAAFTIERRGYYHVDLSEDTTTFRAHRGGSATVTPAAGAATAVAPNQQIVVAGAETPSVETSAAPPLTAWDRWNNQRTAYLIQPTNAQNVSPAMYGTEELAQHGSWRTEATYGPVWAPASVPPGWVPYSAGRWIWDPRFGWTWLDAAPWGWAPYHYGRWVFVRGYWGWAPGPVVVRPLYAPALVVFLGGPVGVAVAARPVHWAPLGWGEPVIPWWGRPGFVGVAWWGGWGGPRVVNNVVVNRTTTVNVTNINVYNNVQVHNAVVGVPEDRFGRGTVQTTRVDNARARELTPVRGPLQIKPVAASAMSADRSTLTPPAGARDRNVVATRTPRDFSPALRAQGLSAEREATPSAAPRIVPAPKRTVAATPPEGPGSSQRPRAGETPSARRPEPSSTPNAGPSAPRPGSRGAPAPESGQSKRPPADASDDTRRLSPPPPPPRNSAEARHSRPHGAPDQRRRPDAKQAQPAQRSPERPPESKERLPEK